MAHRTDLTGRVIIITGASSGIGAATALACADAGMDIVLNARRQSNLDDMAKQVQDRGRRAITVAGDVASPGMATQLLDAAAREFGRFDVVFANAGYGTEAAMISHPMDEIRQMFEVNFFSAVDLLRDASHRLIELGQSGHLLMCASCLARFALPLHGTYCASKAAQHQICMAMRAELWQHNIHVSSVLPITTTTEFFEASAKKSGQPAKPGMVPDHAPKFFVQPPERVANAVVKCLRKPRPEVWTSHTVRLAAGLMTMFPWLADRMMRTQMRNMS